MQTGAETLELCQFDDLEDGAARGFDLFNDGRDTLFVVRRGEHLRAYLNRCPHQGASLPWRKNEYLNKERTHIVCSAHGANFELENGKCVFGPALGQSLESICLSINDAGMVFVNWPPAKRSEG